MFNDCVVAIQWLLNQGLRVAYVDIDVHHGDGVQNAFYDTDRVLTHSLHQDGRTLFPGTGFVNEMGTGDGTGFSVNVPLPPQTYDGAYLRAFEEIVPSLLKRFEPDVLVTQLGVDTHYTDPLASLALTTTGQQTLYGLLGEVAPKWLALGGGGYALDVVPGSWALAFGEMAGSLAGACVAVSDALDETPDSKPLQKAFDIVKKSDPSKLYFLIEAVIAKWGGYSIYHILDADGARRSQEEIDKVVRDIKSN